MRSGLVARLAAFAVVAAVLESCSGRGSMLDPAGPAAAGIAEITWVMTGLGVVVYVLVLATLLLALLRRQRERPLVRDSFVIIAGGIVLPLVVLPIVWVLTLLPMREVAERREAAMTIEVIGHQWWYEVRYPDTDIVLRDELRMPAGVPVRLRLTSADVIHSFWAPRLAGKMDLIPGRVNELVIEASRPGSYLVECAEFCGLWHARMRMEIIAESPQAFALWLERAARAE